MNRDSFRKFPYESGIGDSQKSVNRDVPKKDHGLSVGRGGRPNLRVPARQGRHRRDAVRQDLRHLRAQAQRGRPQRGQGRGTQLKTAVTD